MSGLSLSESRSDPFARFDVVVIYEPATHKRIVKRIIGLPGERIRLAESWKVFINGQAIAYSGMSRDGTRTEAGDHTIEISGPRSRQKHDLGSRTCCSALMSISSLATIAWRASTAA